MTRTVTITLGDDEDVVITKKPATARKTVRVHAILDRSGSMQSRVSDTIGGFNQFLDEQTHDKTTETTISLVQFDTEYELQYRDVPVATAKRLDTMSFQPRGSTALLDAIGRLLNEVGGNTTDANVVLVITDGEENSSRLFTLEDVKGRIKKLEERGNWTFVYLGSDPSTWHAAMSLGYSAGNTVRLANTKDQYRAASQGLSSLKGLVGMGMSLSTTDYFANTDTPTTTDTKETE